MQDTDDFVFTKEEWRKVEDLSFKIGFGEQHSITAAIKTLQDKGEIHKYLP